MSTTTLLRYFLELSDLEEERKENLRNAPIIRLHARVAPLFYLEQDEVHNMEEFKDYISQNDLYTFAFVRHPFERLVSGFEDKLVYNRPAGYYNKLSDKLDSNFTLFVDYLLEQMDNMTSRGCVMTKGRCMTDQHFSPYYSWCGYCDVDYDAIGKAETFSEDLRYVVIKSGLEGVVDGDDFGLKVHSVKHKENRAKEYFAQLTEDKRQRLYEYFKLDFELFDYDAQEYLYGYAL